MILEHRKRTKAEGLGALGAIAVTVIGLGVFQLVLFPSIWAVERWFVIVFAAIEVIVCTLVVAYATINIRAGGTFVCELDEQELRCVCPVGGCGDSFSLRISDIELIE